MKKIFSFFVSLGVLLCLVGPVSADGYYLPDQRQLEGDACVTAYSGYYRNQVFQMDNNVLTKVGFKMKNMNGGTVTLKVKDGITEQIVVEASKRMGSGEGWVEFDLLGDALGYIVEPNHYYSIWVGTDYYSGSDAPCWVYSPTDVYANGMMRQGNTQGAGDMTFYINGYTIDMGRENPGGDDGDDGDTQMVVDEGTGDEEDTTVTETPPADIPDESQDTSEVVKEETDESVTAPVLGKVIVDDVLVGLDEEKGVEVDNGSLVKITGTADAGDTVAVFFGDSAFTAVADEDGNWYVVVNADQGYTVQAQATDENSKASEKVDLFTLTVLGTEEESEDETLVITDEAWYVQLWNMIPEGPWGYVVYALLGFFAFGLLLLLFMLLKRKKRKKKEMEY